MNANKERQINVDAGDEKIDMQVNNLEELVHVYNSKQVWLKLLSTSYL